MLSRLIKASGIQEHSISFVFFKHYQKRSETFKDVDELSKNDHLAVRYSIFLIQNFEVTEI